MAKKKKIKQSAPKQQKRTAAKKKATPKQQKRTAAKKKATPKQQKRTAAKKKATPKQQKRTAAKKKATPKQQKRTAKPKATAKKKATPKQQPDKPTGIINGNYSKLYEAAERGEVYQDEQTYWEINYNMRLAAIDGTLKYCYLAGQRLTVNENNIDEFMMHLMDYFCKVLPIRNGKPDSNETLPYFWNDNKGILYI